MKHINFYKVTSLGAYKLCTMYAMVEITYGSLLSRYNSGVRHLNINDDALSLTMLTGMPIYGPSTFDDHIVITYDELNSGPIISFNLIKVLPM